MDADLKKQIKKWLKDYENTQPGNVQIDEDSFDGAAYHLLSAAIASKPQKKKVCKCKYCGQNNCSSDPGVLCPKCRETFGHTFYNEL